MLVYYRIKWNNSKIMQSDTNHDSHREGNNNQSKLEKSIGNRLQSFIFYNGM